MVADYTAFTNLISTVGFPIACVIVLFYLLYKEQSARREDTEKFLTAINNNTNAMREICEKLKTC